MRAAILLFLTGLSGFAAGEATLPGSKLIEGTNDLSREMVAGIDRFLMRETAEAVKGRTNFWKRDFSSAAAYERSVDANRERLRRMIGTADAREPVKEIEFMTGSAGPAEVASSDSFIVRA